MIRYRFNEFVVSPRQRVLLRNGQEQPLIPRYFDLLVFLIERRHEAVHRRDIFDRVWKDVIVSESALSQAVRTLRRTLGDDSRDPRFIKTVSRHGYRFVCEDVAEEPDALDLAAAKEAADVPAGQAVGNPVDALIPRLLTRPRTEADREDQREAAELLHELGTEEALRHLGEQPGHAYARALLRDTRWDVPSAGAVPIAGVPGGLAAAWALVHIRLRRARRLAAERGAAAAAGAGAAGAAAGAVGGLLIAALPNSMAPAAVAAVLAVIGGACGAWGGVGVGAGLAAAEAAARSWRRTLLVAGGALGGTLAGALAQWLGHVTLSTIVGLDMPVGGSLEGLVIGGAAGLAYSVGTRGADEGLAAPRGRRRWTLVALMTLACTVAAAWLTLSGRPLVGGTIHLIATASSSAAALTPLGRLVGEPDFGPVAQTVLGTAEGALFGLGIGLGLTRRPRS